MSRESEARCRRYRRRILEISQKVSALHIAPAFSCLEIVDTIYHDLLTGPNDVFLMSKGHGVMAQYVVLEDIGVLPKEELERYATPSGSLGAHPDRGNPGIVASTGSLGHGLSLAVGMAYAEHLKRSKARVFVLLSDGECQEGSTWEAMMMAANLKLANLIAFVDSNNQGGLVRMSDGFPAFAPLHEKVRTFGWDCVRVWGHGRESILYPLQQPFEPQKPRLLECQTVKGQGVSFMQDQAIWHYRSPNPEEYAKAMEELRD